MTNATRICLAVSVFVLSSCAPLQTVRPVPEFVTTAIKPGDQVELVTDVGERLKFEVTHIDAHSIDSRERSIALEEIDELYIRSKDRVKVPCGLDEESGCPMHGKVDVLGIPMVFGYSNKMKVFWGHIFYYACLQRDLCYRHGHKTYGYDKEVCDNQFYRDMIEICYDDPDCFSAARERSNMVKEEPVEGVYQTTTSTYCEYDGPVINAE